MISNLMQIDGAHGAHGGMFSDSALARARKYLRNTRPNAPHRNVLQAGGLCAHALKIHCWPTLGPKKFTDPRYPTENSGFSDIASKRAPDFVMGIGSEYAG